MTDEMPAAGQGELLAEAVRVLTAAARLRRPVGFVTDNESTEPADFAEFVTLAVAGAAANIGGVEEVLAGRPGSWEAEYVRNMLLSTVGEDDTSLLAHRTEPLRIVVNVDDILDDLGVWKPYDDADDELLRREEAIGIPSFAYRPGDPESEAGYATWAATAEPPTRAQEAALEVIETLRERLDALREADCAAYGAAFAERVLRAASELLPTLTVPVEVTVETRWQNSLGPGDSWSGPEFRLWEKARLETPLPWSGLAPQDYPPGPIEDTDRAAGRTPLARIEQAD